MVPENPTSAHVGPLGNLSTGWPVANLKDITLKIGSGATPLGGASAYLPVRHRFALIRSQNVFDRHFGGEGLAFISDEQADHLCNAQVQSGDVLLNITGDGVTFGRSCLVPLQVLPACVNQHVSIVRVNPDLCSPGYLLSYLTDRRVKQYIESFNAGGSRRAITKEHIGSFEISLPPLPEQQAIADILGSLDNKIELNRRMNGTLEAMARAIFRSWFMDFDPVRAKAEGRQPGGMDPETAALFPNAFEDSELGKTPKGWATAALAEHLEAVRGLSYKGAGLSDRGRPLHNLNSVLEGGGYKYPGIKYYTRDYKARNIARPGDVIVANTEQGFEYLLIGFPAIVPKRFGEGGLFSHHLYRVRPLSGSPLTAAFTYFLLMTGYVREQVIGCTNGTTVNMLPPSGLQIPRFVTPPATLISRFDELALPMLQRQEANYEENAALAAVRDALLPKLLSGEIRVKDAEKLAEEAL